jgi:hypothetical protein
MLNLVVCNVTARLWKVKIIMKQFYMNSVWQNKRTNIQIKLVQGAVEKPDGFQNEVTQWSFTLLCNSCYHWWTQCMTFYVLKISSLMCPPPFLKHCSNLARKFSITRRVICSGIAAISSFILCFSFSMVPGLEMERSLLRHPHKK